MSASVSGTLEAERLRVIAASIPADFDPTTDVVPGPWILAGEEAAWPDWEDYSFELPLASVDEIAAADELTGRIAVCLTAEFADNLATRHGSDRSPEFWYLLLIRWVLETVQAAWLRYREAERLVAEADRPFVIKAPPADQAWRFADIADMYRRGICDRYYNTWLLAMALKSLRPDGLDWQVQPVKEMAPGAAQNSIRTGGIFRRLNAAMKNGRCEVGNMGSEYNLATKTASAFAHGILNLWLEIVPAKSKIRSRRAHADPALTDKIGAGLYAYLVDVLERSLPLPFGESFAHYDRAARRTRTRKGRLSIKTISYQMSADRLFEAAHRIDRGEGLVHLQHGGNYGVCRAYSLGGLVEYNQHAFLTWGWTTHGEYEGRFIPLPAPQLEPWLRSHRTRTDRILLVSSVVPFLPNRLISNGELHCHRRRTDRTDFIAALPGNLRDKLIYRPYPQRVYGAEDAEFFSREFPDIEQVQDQPTFFRESRRCRLMVLDHPGLTLYQALAAGTPFIGFWTDLQWPMDKAVKPLFDELRRVGALFDSGDEAAIALGRRWQTIEEWWLGEDLQKAVERLRDHNAVTSRGWLPIWLKAMRAL